MAHVERTQLAIETIANLMRWPRVEIVMNYADAGAGLIDALLSQMQAGHKDPVRGIVVAATGNGTIHHALEAALICAQVAGISVVRATRCAQGRVISAPGNRFPDSQGLSPVKARIALMLSLI
jgi:L-asparaginase